MRWGVGKGKFRNLTAIILSLILALIVLAVWSFFNRIKPLMVDTSSRSQTASISERLINSETDTSKTLDESDVVLFNDIADSLQKIFLTRFPSSRIPKGSSDSILQQLRRVQIEARKKIGFMLNQSYTPMSRFRQTELKVLKVLWTDNMKSSLRQFTLNTPLELRTAVERVRSDFESVELPESDRMLIQEFSHILQPKVLPLYLGISNDSFLFSDTIFPAKHEQMKKTEVKK